MKYIIIAGLTRRLVEADNPRAARLEFLKNVPRAHLLAVPYEKCRVYEATDDDVAEFLRGRVAQFDGQQALDLGDPRKPQTGNKGGRKEHA